MRALCFLLVLLAGAPVFAQPAHSAQVDRREKIKQRIRALRAYTLTEELRLDEATAAKVFPALAKYDDEIEKLLVQRADLVRRLADAESLKDTKAIDQLIDDALANQRALWSTEEKRVADLRKILTPAQTARLLVVLPALERKIQNQLRRAVKGARAGKRRAQQLRDSDDSDDDDDEPDEAPAPRPSAKDLKGCDPFSVEHPCRDGRR